MKSNGFNFDNKHSFYDLNLLLESKSIQPPDKKKIKVDVPGMNGFYDFSTIASGGEIIYGERIITVVLGFPIRSKVELYSHYSRVLEWLQDVGKSRLIFDDLDYYYFMAEVESASSFEEMIVFGKMTVTFVAEPFKVGIDPVGNTIWNTFNFLEDVLQDSSYDVVGTKTVIIYNPGRLVTPTINCSVPMSIVFAGKTYPMVAGNNLPYGLKLLNGNNSLVINGTGHVSILFKKVIL